MKTCNSLVDRDVDTDTEELEDTNAELLNKANNTQDRDGAYEASSGGSPFTSSVKSETITIPQGSKDGE